MSLDWSNLTVKLIRATNSQWRRGVKHSENWKKKVIVDNDLWIMNGGEGEMETRSGKLKLNSDAIVWMRPGHTYAVSQNPDRPIGMAYFHFELLRPDGGRCYPTTGEIPEALHSFNSPQWRLMGQSIIRLMQFQDFISDDDLQKEKLPVAETMLKAMLMSLEFFNLRSRRGAQQTGRHRQLALQAALYIEETPECFVPVSRLAEKFKLNRNSFTRIFSEYWKMSPQDYQISHRISRAKSLLQNGSEPIREIAAHLGYSDRFFFARQFKEKTGVSPGAFRRLNQSSSPTSR